MPTLAIRLLGPPEIERDGVPTAPPRGYKAWAVLAYVVLAERRVARARLAGLIFGDAQDPLGALRWTLAQLRRALGAGDALRGDPLELALPDGAAIDVLALASGALDPALARGELLEGVVPGAGSDFDAWLLVERRRFAGVCEAVLRDAALAALAAGDPLDGAALASRVLALHPFDDAAHELLVRCLVRAGDLAGAREHAEACEALFRRELGRTPDPGVRRAATEPSAPAAGDRAAALGQLDAGRAALDAGAVEPGIACLRHAAAEARGVGDPALLARVLAALGVALVHAMRGGDAEGTAMLHEALALAEAAGDREVACKACRELGFVAAQAGRGVSAGTWLQRAGALAQDDRERAAVLGLRGQALSDRAHYGAASTLLEESIAIARRSGDLRQAAWSLALLGRALLLRGRAGGRRRGARRLALPGRGGGLGGLPSVPRGGAGRGRAAPGRPRARDRAARARVPARLPARRPLLGGDRRTRARPRPRGGGRAGRSPSPGCATRRRAPGASPTRTCGCARTASTRSPASRSPRPPPMPPSCVAELERLAARADMRELVVRAALHRARLGDPSGVEAARLLGEAIDNPVLHAELAAAA